MDRRAWNATVRRRSCRSGSRRTVVDTALPAAAGASSTWDTDIAALPAAAGASSTWDTDIAALTDADLADYEQALDALLAGDWERAYDLLHLIPSDDRAKDFLTIFIAQHNRTPPSNWDGVIPLSSK